jgi:dual-specificity kinase
VGPGDWLARRYRVLAVSGEGKFSRVVHAYDREQRRAVAVKIVRAVPRYAEGAAIEARILAAVRQREPDPARSLVVGYGGDFEYRGHTCLVLELLGVSVYDFLQRNRFVPFAMPVIRHVLY